MKFETLKEFWEWLTISSGDLQTDCKAVREYFNCADSELLTWAQFDLLAHYVTILTSLSNEQQFLELK
jgi:hypothetical protein